MATTKAEKEALAAKVRAEASGDRGFASTLTAILALVDKAEEILKLVQEVRARLDKPLDVKPPTV